MSRHIFHNQVSILIIILVTGMSSLLRVSGQNYLPDNIDSVACAYSPPQQVWGIVQGASSPTLSHMYAQPLIGDIDNDGQNEVITVGYYDSPSLSSSVVIYGQNLQHKYTITTQRMFVYGGYPIAIADVDRDGFAEIFVQNADGFLRCYHHNGSLVWTSSATVSGPDSKSPGLILADINGDGIPEIWSLNKIFNAVSGVELIALPEIVGKANLYMSSDKFGVMPVFADFDNDGVMELAGGNKVYKLSITNSTGTAGNNASLWKSISGFDDGLTSVADIDLDGFLDLVVVRSHQMYAWKPYSGSGSNPQLISSHSHGSNSAGRALLTDVNNDGYPEILFTFGTNLAAYRYTAASQSLQQFWLKSTSDLSGATTLTAFDFNQDGSVEIVYRDQSDMRIIDGNTGNNISVFPCLAPTAVEYPAIADLDRDGQADIIASSSTYDVNHDKHAKMVVFHSPASTVWAPARHVWNQHAYNVVNVNNDLTVPAVNFNPSTTFTDPSGVVRRPFNNFLQQATTLDQYGRPFMSLANLASTNDTSVTYGNNSVSFSFTFCNNGGQTLESPFSITYYANSYHGPIIRTETVNSSLPVGNCTSITAQFTNGELLAFTGLTTIVVAINDNGTGVAQTGGQQDECDTTDNFFLFPANPRIVTYDTVYADICTRDTYSDENFDIPATETAIAGTFFFSRVFQSGNCDSVIVLKLTVHPDYDIHLTETLPEGTDYDLHGLFFPADLLTRLGHLDTLISLQSLYGCDSILRISISIALPELTLYLPNAITPNGDGLNDCFSLPEIILPQIADFEIRIFNRWGEKVFYSKDKRFKWDGVYRGEIRNNTIFPYIIRIMDILGEKHILKGEITVLR